MADKPPVEVQKWTWPSERKEPILPPPDAKMKQAVIDAISTLPVPGARTIGQLFSNLPDFPEPQQVDMSGVTLPSVDFPAFIVGAFVQGTENIGMVLEDMDHDEKGPRNLLAKTKVVSAMKKAGITHFFIEMSPSVLDHTRRGDIAGEALKDRFAVVRRIWLQDSRWPDMVKAYDDAGITVVPVDTDGPASLAYDAERLRLRMAVLRGETMQNEPSKEITGAFQAERIRITNQLWVPRVKEVMDEALKHNPNARFAIMAGMAHISNMPMQVPEPNHSDLDESLASAFGKGVMHVRLQGYDRTKLITLAPESALVDRNFGPRDVLKGLDTPNAVVHVPPSGTLAVQDSAIFSRSIPVVKKDASVFIEAYYHRLNQFMLKNIAITPEKVMPPEQSRKLIDMFSELHALPKRFLKGDMDAAAAKTRLTALAKGWMPVIDEKADKNVAQKFVAEGWRSLDIMIKAFGELELRKDFYLSPEAVKKDVDIHYAPDGNEPKPPVNLPQAKPIPGAQPRR